MSEIFFYVQNLLGIGHLRRAAVLAKAMAQAGLSVDFVAGGVPVPGLDPGPARLVQLPPVRSADERFSALLDDRGIPIDEAWREGRRAALLEAFAASDPDALLIELYPFGRRAFRFELLPLIEAASARPHRPEILCSVRDILVEKGKSGRAEEAAALVERHFDAVLVHGDPAIAPFSASFPAADRIAGRLRYTGYVVEPRMPPEAPGPVPEGEVLLSAGGGAVGRPFVEAALAARPISKAKGLPWRVVLGPQYPEPEAARLVAMAGPGLAVERFRPDLAQLFAGCSLSISQAGYNTVLELVAAGARAIVVPFSAGAESEQAARARLFAERGLLTVVEEGLLGPAALARAIDAALARPRPAPGGGLRLDGARATAAFLLEAVARRRASRHDGAAPTGSGMGGQRRS
ncbi:MAG TPA: glycosyltransferase [Methylomirabilota bacterium]|jgi:predicted glycosyltransferase|nr:glycosyltransferase [Methylomirabilota bacterium]